MRIVRCADRAELGQKAAAEGAEAIRRALQDRAEANIILATGVSQFEMLSALVREPGIDWSRVTAFHLDEYAGMPISHPASFRKYLKERFVEQLPGPLRAFHYINAEGDAEAECERLGALIRAHPVDAAFIGIGENGHLAFNDPPANFQTEKPYLVVTLDQRCRQQQVGEGWFLNLQEVPTQAISMSIRQIIKSRHIICSAPEERKAEAVRGAVEGPVTPDLPASILQQHPQATLYVDPGSAALLSR